MEWLLLIAGTLGGGAIAAWLAVRSTRSKADETLAVARAEAAAIRRAADSGAHAAVQAAETAAREHALELRDRALRDTTTAIENQARREERLAKREAGLAAELPEIEAHAAAVTERERNAQSRHDRARNQKLEADKLLVEWRAAVEKLAGATADEIKTHMAESWIEEVRADCAQRLRAIDQNAADPEYARQAKRIMGIAVQRYHAHFLTERLLSNIALPPGMAERLAADGNALLGAIQEGSGVKLELAETGERVRLDSGDGVAREVARRALHKLIKGTTPRGFDKDPKKWVEQLRANLEREIVDLGKRAFAELEIPKAHPEIVKLVGCLNYRTSYTQNQWKHALEASFLGGMMAAELGLDVKLARRATLMHDIGKALTHEIEGPHAVIGADYARRLGEHEIVANAIGAHHADEPPNSIYAYLVAAADAMSGARPGARREQTEQYSTKLEDLERIGFSFRGVERAHAVQGGREVRVYVRERDVDDVRAVELSSEIARKISDEMTFPGQIKVTVIRTVEAVEVAN
jgi:ribonuclease Y